MTGHFFGQASGFSPGLVHPVHRRVVGIVVELDQLGIEGGADGVRGVCAVGEHRVGEDGKLAFGHEHQVRVQQ
jgi:hypothetical protein